MIGKIWAESYSRFGLAAPALAQFVDASPDKYGGFELDSWKQDAKARQTFRVPSSTCSDMPTRVVHVVIGELQATSISLGTHRHAERVYTEVALTRIRMSSNQSHQDARDLLSASGLIS